MFYEVIPTEIYRNNGGELTYHSDLRLTPGQLVLIPLGRKTVTGVVLRRVPPVNFPTKSILRLIHPYPLPSHLLKAITWLSDYYLSPLPNCAELMVPNGLVSKALLKQALSAPGILDPLKTPAETPRLCVVNTFPEGIRTPRGGRAPDTRDGGLAGRAPRESVLRRKAEIQLNSAQQNALRALQEAPGATRLLLGVTGSGKTNIYLKMTSETLREQKSVILLVPEIALTSQLVQVFEETFGNLVTVIHSQQTQVTRRQTWLDLLESRQPRIVIGPRSALLSPLSNLGLIIVDEAHEGAYYQENPPRYSALRLASFMAQQLKIPCIAGTATPNVVDYHLAKAHNSLVTLSEKAKSTALAPEFTSVDFKNRANFSKNRYFSDQLLEKIAKNLDNHQQTLVFHNRRGSSPLTICENCGWQALCPECYLPMVLHADDYTLTCHICGHTEKVPSSCPICHHPNIVHKGFGTKLLESELQRLFPGARIARFDGDTKKSENLADQYQTVKSGKIDLLIGTQTLARGLDLPHLATVGIIQADAGLSLPDFAAEERSFELLTQVIGRVGRGHIDTAEVIIQTFQPEHPVIQTAMRADYATFADYILKQRRKQQLPPFSYLARLAITYKTEKTTFTKIRAVQQALARNPKLQVSPPMPAFHEHTARGFTWELIAKSTSRETLRTALMPFSQYHIELDPPSLL